MAWRISSIEQAWKFLIALGAGTGLVYILRWYWWRINAWSEISAMVVSFVAVAIVALQVVPHALRARRSQRRRLGHAGDGGGDDGRLVSGHLADARRSADAVLDPSTGGFAPADRGGGASRSRPDSAAKAIAAGRFAWINWIAGIVAAYATLFGIGKLIFGPVSTGLVMLAVAARRLCVDRLGVRGRRRPPARPQPPRTRPGADPARRRLGREPTSR